MDAKMRSKARKQRKLMQILSTAIKILRKAGDLYVKGMEYCSNQVSSSGSVGCSSAPAMRLPKSFSVNSFPACDDEEFRQLLRVASIKEARKTDLQRTMIARSYSVSVGKIGRIDEDEPCAFQEDVLKLDLLFPRSTSHAVRTNCVI